MNQAGPAPPLEPKPEERYIMYMQESNFKTVWHF
jgi:hypothetical protein